MNKKLYILFILLFIYIGKVDAANFYEGDFISGEYINRVDGNKIYYSTIQYIYDGNGNIVYCIEPFVMFDDDVNYNLVEPYYKYNDDVLRRVELLSYYGYGYKNRTDSKWYVITQYLIWKSVVDNDIYFTDKLNGKRIDKYVNEINELNNDVINHDKSNLVLEYDVDYKDDISLNINGYKVINSDYEIKNNIINNVVNDGIVTVSKDSSYYTGYRGYYDGFGSQSLLVRGNVINALYDIKINVRKGNILLDITVDNKDKFDVCYTISNKVEEVDKVCTNGNLIYKSIDLSYGEYVIKQSSISEGYIVDNKEYVVKVEGDKSELKLNNYIISNDLKINKYYCYLSNCDVEDKSKFEVYDLENNLIGTIVTNSEGYGEIELLYGTYLIKHVGGMEGYSYISDFYVTIDNEVDDYRYSLSSNKIIEVDEIPNTGDSIECCYVLVGLLCGLWILKGLVVYER